MTGADLATVHVLRALLPDTHPLAASARLRTCMPKFPLEPDAINRARLLRTRVLLPSFSFTLYAPVLCDHRHPAHPVLEADSARERADTPSMPTLKDAIDGARSNVACQGFSIEARTGPPAVLALNADAAPPNPLPDVARLGAIGPLRPLSPFAIKRTWELVAIQCLLWHSDTHPTTMLMHLLSAPAPLFPTTSTAPAANRKPRPNVPRAIDRTDVRIASLVVRVVAHAVLSAEGGHRQTASLSDAEATPTSLLADTPAVPHFPRAVNRATLRIAGWFLFRGPVAHSATILGDDAVDSTPFFVAFAARLGTLCPLIPQIPYAVHRTRLDIANFTFRCCCVTGDTAELLRNLLALSLPHPTRTGQRAL